MRQPRNTPARQARQQTALETQAETQRRPAFPFQAALQSVARLLADGFRRAQQMRAAHAGAKRLRVIETVALGEKRFAAVLQVDGVQFLVGGGAGTVSLLATLSAAAEPVCAPLRNESVQPPNAIAAAEYAR